MTICSCEQAHTFSLIPGDQDDEIDEHGTKCTPYLERALEALYRHPPIRKLGNYLRLSPTIRSHIVFFERSSNCWLDSDLAGSNGKHNMVKIRRSKKKQKLQPYWSQNNTTLHGTPSTQYKAAQLRLRWPRVPLTGSTSRTMPPREKAMLNSATIVRSKLDQGFPPEHVGKGKVGAATSMPSTRERRQKAPPSTTPTTTGVRLSPTVPPP